MGLRAPNGITGPTNAGHPYIKIRCLSRGIPILGNWGERANFRRLAETKSDSKACDRLGFVVVDIKNRVKLGDLKEIADLLVEIQQLQFSALALYEPVPAHQFPKACAVKITDGGQIEHELLMALVEVFANQIAQQRAAVAKSDSTVQVNHDHTADFAAGCFERHRGTLSFQRERISRLPTPYFDCELFRVRYRFAMISSAPPPCPTRTSNSSMNALINNTPRPASPNMFSSNRGSGTSSSRNPTPWSATRITIFSCDSSKMTRIFFSRLCSLPY